MSPSSCSHSMSLSIGAQCAELSMPHRPRKRFTGVLNILAWLVFAFAVGVSLVGFLSPVVRTSRRRSFKNIDVLIISVTYIVVVGSVFLSSNRHHSIATSGKWEPTNQQTVPDDAGILRETKDIGGEKVAQVVEGTCRTSQRRCLKGARGNAQAFFFLFITGGWLTPSRSMCMNM